MLSTIKNKSRGWITYLIVGLITIPFALFGINQYFTGTSNIIVASVDDDDISRDAFLLQFNPQQRRLQQQLGEKYSPEFDARLRQSIVRQMIDNNLLEKFIKDLNYITSAEELYATIQSDDTFKTDGKFSLEKYQQVLRLNGYNVSKYESTKLKELTQGQIKYNLLNSAFIVPKVLDNLQTLNNQQREFDYIQINADDYTNNIKVEEQKIKDFYEENEQSFFEAEKIKVEFIELSLNEISKKIKVEDNDLLGFYEQEKERFTAEEERRAQHILVDTEQIAKKVIKLLSENGDFDALAKEYSQDTGSKDNAGDLGFFARGIMVPEFEQKVFSMNESEISEPIKSEFGYHIIKLNEIKLAKTKSFAEAKEDLADMYTESEARKILYDSAEKLANLAYEISLEEVSERMNLKLNNTDFFDRNNQQYDRKFISAAFSDTVKNKGETSEVVELDKSKFVVMKLKETKPQRQKSFDEVKDQIKADLTISLAKNYANSIASKLIEFLQNGDATSAEDLIVENKFKWNNVGWVNRNSEKATANIINNVFVLTKPSETNPTYTMISDASKNNINVIKLKNIRNPDVKINPNLERSVLNFEADEIFVNIIKNLRENSDTRIFSEYL